MVLALVVGFKSSASWPGMPCIAALVVGAHTKADSVVLVSKCRIQTRALFCGADSSSSLGVAAVGTACADLLKMFLYIGPLRRTAAIMQFGKGACAAKFAVMLFCLLF
jgi:hypothetical protein